MSNRTPPKRHPSTDIPDETVIELAYRVYLHRLEPPLTLAEAETYRRVDDKGRVTDVAALRANSKCMLPMAREFLRALVDMEMVQP